MSRSKVFVSKFQEIFNLRNSGFATNSDFIISKKNAVNDKIKLLALFLELQNVQTQKIVELEDDIKVVKLLVLLLLLKVNWANELLKIEPWLCFMFIGLDNIIIWVLSSILVIYVKDSAVHVHWTKQYHNLSLIFNSTVLCLTEQFMFIVLMDNIITWVMSSILQLYVKDRAVHVNWTRQYHNLSHVFYSTILC